MITMTRRQWLQISFGLGATFGGAATAAEPLDWVDPELRAMAKTISAMPPLPADASSIPKLRGMSKTFAQPSPMATVPYRKALIPGRNGAPHVTIYIINAKAGAHRPAILHTHGGGFIGGSAKDSIRGLQELARTLDCGVVTVDYRLAPETTWQGSREDNYAGLLWLSTHAAEVGIDPARIALMGESAGGGHAALLAIAARDRGEVKPCYQMLIYPMLDDRTGSTRVPPANEGKVMWSASMNRLGWGSFLGAAAGSATVPQDAVPARVADLSNLPPAFIGVGSVDLFVDEDIDYARRLVDAGVSTSLVVVPGAYHGFDGMVPQAKVSRNFMAARLDALNKAFQS